jgi:FkbM family methyltransferase
MENARIPGDRRVSGAHAHASAFQNLARWYEENQAGGWRVRWRRRKVWPAQFAQKLGMQRRVRAPLFFGREMWVVTGEVTSSQLLAFGYSEQALTALMLRWLRPGDAMIDVGTHFGYEALLGAHLVGPQGRVYAMEPNPLSYEIARANLGGLNQCTLLRAGAADRDGVLRLETGGLANSAFARFTDRPRGDYVEVPVTTIESVVSSQCTRVRLLKCDAEGFEEQVLQGARSVIARDRPLVVVEVGMRCARSEVDDRTAVLLRGVGSDYTAFDFEFDGRLRIGPAGALEVGHANVALVPSELREEFIGIADSI